MAGLSSYRNYVGVAKVTTDGLVANSGGIAALATSVTVTVLDGTPLATMSVTFLDGPNTETVALSAYSAGVATIAATTYAHPQGCYMLFQPTASLGPTNYMPVRTFKVPDKYDQLYDLSHQGSLVAEMGVVQGIRASEWDIEGDVFGDTFGFILGGLYGSSDFTSGSPNTWAFGVNNQSNGQPVKYAYYVYDGVNMRIVVGRITSVTMKFDPKALISYTAKLLARASGVVATTTPSYALTVLPSWRAVATFASNYIRTPLSAEFTLARSEAENIPTLNGTQDPYDTFVGALKSSGKISIVKEDDSWLSNYLAGTIYTFSLAFLQGTGATQIGLTMQFTKANSDTDEPILQGKSYNTEDISFTGVANTTDATTSGGGESTSKVILKNAVATGSYT
ncbi:MAG TPA: hypothetical protein VGP46_09825 [Acidimicrobiales bacterium]|nr:hypothetical protein [Acidimicrobiales bacterium]